MTGTIIPTGEWITKPAARNKALRILKEVLAGVGDTAFERTFRMNVTLCIHRAMTRNEVAELPEWWHRAPAGDGAGPAVEVVSSRGATGRPVQQPCDSPRRVLPPISGYDPRLWFPEGCGQCEPCLDRVRVREEES